MRYHFHRFVLDRKIGTLQGADGHTVRLRRQAFVLLTALVEHYPNIVARDALIDRVWGPDHVSTGSLPQTVSELRQALGDDAQHPRLIQTVHRRGYRFVAPVTFSPTLEMLKPYAVSGPGGRSRTTLSTAGNKRRGAITAAIVLALAITGFLGRVQHGTALAKPEPGTATTPSDLDTEWIVGRAPTVAILGFDNLGRRAQDAWLDAALGEMLATELTLAGDLRVVDRETLHTLSTGSLVGKRATDDPVPNLSQLGLEIGADYVLRGSYLIRGDDSNEVRLDLRLVDTASGEPVTSVRQIRTTDALIDLVADVGETLRRRLMPHAILRAPRVPSSDLTPRPNARPYYFAGLAALRRNDLRDALQLLRDASALDPHSHAIESGLTSVLAELGHEQQARDAADRAWALGRQLASRLSTRERRWLEARRDELHDRPDLALAAYRELATAHPQALPYHLRLTTTLIRQGRGADALTHLELVRGHEPAPAILAHLDLLEARAAATLSAYSRQDDAAARSEAFARRYGATTLQARALLLRGQAARHLGARERAHAHTREALRLFGEADDPGGAVRARLQQAELALAFGDLETAAKHAYDARVEGRAIGNRSAAAQSELLLARTRHRQGRRDEAWQAHDAALAGFQTLGNRRSLSATHRIAATLLLHEGALDQAEARAQEGLVLAEHIQDRQGLAASWDTIGAIRARSRGFDRALDAWRSALDLYRTIGDRPRESAVLERMAGVHTARGQLDPARGLHRAALAVHRRHGNATQTARTLYSLALIDAHTGHLARAKRQLEQAVTLLGSSGDALATCWVKRKLGDVLALADQAEAAQRALDDTLEVCRSLAGFQPGDLFVTDFAGTFPLYLSHAELGLQRGGEIDALDVAP